MQKIILYFLFFTTIKLSFSQPINSNSLTVTQILNSPDDTTKINSLIKIIKLYADNKSDSALLLSEISLSASKKINYPLGEVKTLLLKGMIFINLSDYKEALNVLFTALKLSEKLNLKELSSACYGNIGIVYAEQANYSLALENYFKSLRISQEINDKGKISSVLNNIGIIYFSISDYDKALDYFFSSLKYSRELKKKYMMANTISYIGNVYRRKKDYYRALIYNFKALSLYEEEKNKSGIATVLYRIGVIYFNKKNYNKSVDYLEKSYSINNELKKKRENANVLSYLARNYIDYPSLPPLEGETEKGYKIAEKYIKRAIEISDSIGAKNIVYENVQLLSQFYEMLADKMEKGNKISGFENASILRKKALDELKKYIQIKDSINLAEQRNNKKNMEVQFEFEKKVAAEKAINEKKQMKLMQEQKILKIIIYLSIVIIVLIIFFSYMIYKSWKKTQRQKIIIETAHHEIEKQKNMLEEKNKDITDSIHYASRIQQALITGENYIDKFISDYFIFFKPRDIVSGDFYWAMAIKETNNKNEKILILTGDCTGHGVPGAFMSLLNISLLNQVVIERKITRPDLILNEIRNSVIKILNPNSDSIEKKDGMDCVLFSIDPNNQVLQAACANNSFCIIRNENLIEVEPDKIPVGYSHDNHRLFNLHEMKLEKGDMLFTFTDGYADQFGGPNGKKFKNKNLKQLFLSLSNKSVFEQKKEINHVFDSWKGNLDQVDDVLVIGIRI